MNTRSELHLAQETIETQIQIVAPQDAIRDRLVKKVAFLTDAGVMRLHALIEATLDESVTIDLSMLEGFIDRSVPVVETERV